MRTACERLARQIVRWSIDPPRVPTNHSAFDESTANSPGSKAKPLLAELGHPVPDGWVVVQDHVRKGLVVALPETAAPSDALAWLLRAARLLSTIPLQGEWRATIYPG
jgi:hypothetical protein